MGVTILATGAGLPSDRATSAELEERLGLEAGWIESRTGIRSRPVVAREEATSDLAVKAGARCLEAAGADPAGIGLLLLATSTPDHPLPPTAPAVAHRLGLDRAGAVDLAGACAGFLYALDLAHAHAAARDTRVLVVGANVLTRRCDPDDIRTAALFADGAGAVLLGPGPEGSGLLASALGSDGSAWEAITVPGGGSRRPLTAESIAAGEDRMRFQESGRVFRLAVRGMVEAGREALERAGLGVEAVDWWVPHQANRRVMKAVGRALGIPEKRTVDIVAEHANSSAATIPLALDAASREGRLRRGQVVLLTAAGAGMVRAGVVLRW